MCVEVREGERVYDGFFKLFDNVFKATNVLECDGYVFGSNDFHGY